MAYFCACATNAGKKAEAAGRQNEDRAHFWVTHDVMYQVLSDGNGGTEELQPAGFVINEIQRLIEISSAPNMSVSEIKRMLLSAIHCANRVLLAFKRANGELYTSNTFATLCMTAITPNNEFVYAYSGDSRVYLFRQGSLTQISKDHTEAQRLCDEGKISKEEIFSHPDRDILTSALGFNDPKIEIFQATLQKGDIVLLLTDGIHKLLSSAEIEQIIGEAGNCEDSCDGLLKFANHKGGPDNMSVSIAYINEE